MAKTVIVKAISLDFSTTIFAVLGASSKKESFSNKAFRALRTKSKAVIPIHPKNNLIEGCQSYPDIVSIPLRPDVLTVYLSEDNFLPLLDDVEQRGAGEIWLNPGADSQKVIRELMKRNLPFKKTCTIVEAGFQPSEL